MCSTTASAKPGSMAIMRATARTLAQHQRHDGEDRGDAAVHERRAEPAHDPGPDAGVRDRMQEIQVLDDREARADREAADRGVDREADAMRANQHDNHRRFQKLLDDRSDIARERHGVDAKHRPHDRVDCVADGGDTAPHATTPSTIRSRTSL